MSTPKYIKFKGATYRLAIKKDLGKMADPAAFKSATDKVVQAKAQLEPLTPPVYKFYDATIKFLVNTPDAGLKDLGAALNNPLWAFNGAFNGLWPLVSYVTETAPKVVSAVGKALSSAKSQEDLAAQQQQLNAVHAKFSSAGFKPLLTLVAAEKQLHMAICAKAIRVLREKPSYAQWAEAVGVDPRQFCEGPASDFGEALNSLRDGMVELYKLYRGDRSSDGILNKLMHKQVKKETSQPVQPAKPAQPK